jgi:hypothetical protein
VFMDISSLAGHYAKYREQKAVTVASQPAA